MYRLSIDDITKLIIACNKQSDMSVDFMVRKQYSYLAEKLRILKEQNYNCD